MRPSMPPDVSPLVVGAQRRFRHRQLGDRMPGGTRRRSASVSAWRRTSDGRRSPGGLPRAGQCERIHTTGRDRMACRRRVPVRPASRWQLRALRREPSAKPLLGYGWVVVVASRRTRPFRGDGTRQPTADACWRDMPAPGRLRLPILTQCRVHGRGAPLASSFKRSIHHKASHLLFRGFPRIAAIHCVTASSRAIAPTADLATAWRRPAGVRRDGACARASLYA